RLSANGSGKRRFSAPTAKRIVKQVLLALDCLHRECGCIHTGNSPPDLTQESVKNVLLRSPVERYKPMRVPSLSPDPIITIRSQPLPNIGLKSSLENFNIKLIDFGQAETVDTAVVPGQTLQPKLVRAPAVVMGLSWSPAMNIRDFLTNELLFFRNLPKAPFSPTLHLQHMEELLGPFPM
ncbi:hypothetical protein C8F04DRAFT_913814, partial [Mycena alexandri]